MTEAEQPKTRVVWTIEEQWSGWAIRPTPGSGYVTVRVGAISNAGHATALAVMYALNAAAGSPMDEQSATKSTRCSNCGCPAFTHLGPDLSCSNRLQR